MEINACMRQPVQAREKTVDAASSGYSSFQQGVPPGQQRLFPCQDAHREAPSPAPVLDNRAGFTLRWWYHNNGRAAMMEEYSFTSMVKIQNGRRPVVSFYQLVTGRLRYLSTSAPGNA